MKQSLAFPLDKNFADFLANAAYNLIKNEGSSRFILKIVEFTFLGVATKRIVNLIADDKNQPKSSFLTRIFNILCGPLKLLGSLFILRYVGETVFGLLEKAWQKPEIAKETLSPLLFFCLGFNISSSKSVLSKPNNA